jgi:biopolymer transport protein ExbD
MNLRPRRQEPPDINLTPLIDVVFLLLIFFMVSTTFRKETDLEIDLPTASQQHKPAEQEALTVAVDAQGRYSVNEQPLAETSIEVLKVALSEAAGERRDLPFTIRADGQAPHQSVVTVLDAAGQLGFRRLGIATVQATPRDGTDVDR